MKRFISKIIFIIVIFTFTIPINSYALYEESLNEFTPLLNNTLINGSYDKTFRGYKNGTQLIENITFSDIEDSPYKKDIIKMAALSVVKTYGNDKFYPNKFLTKQEAIKFLVRLSGYEEDIQREIAEELEGINGNIVDQIINEKYAQRAVDIGIIEEEDNYNLNSYISKQIFLKWIGNAFDIEPVYNDIEKIYTYRDYYKVSKEYIGIIEALLQEGIYKGEDDYLNLDSSITREEAMDILNNTDEFLYKKMELSQYRGLVIDKETTEEKYGNVTTKVTTIVVMNTDGTLNQIQIEKKLPYSEDEDIVYIDTSIKSYEELSIGTEIIYIGKDDQIIYVEGQSNGEIMKNIEEIARQRNDLKVYEGTVVLKRRETHLDDSHFYYIDRCIVRDEEGNEYDLAVPIDPTKVTNRDLIVYKDNIVGGNTLLEEGDEIEYIVKDDKYVLYIKVKEFPFLLN